MPVQVTGSKSVIVTDAPLVTAEKKLGRPCSVAASLVKRTIIFLCMLSLQSYASGFGQAKVTLQFKDAPLLKVLTEIRKQTGYNYIMPSAWSKKAVNVDIKVTGVPLQDALELCFRNQPFSYVLSGNSIVISAKKAVTYATPISRDGEVKGRVLNENGDPLEGVTVAVKGTGVSTVTNVNGEFSLTVNNASDKLVFTSVNMETYEVSLRGQSSLTVNLRRKVAALEDVTVTVNTGYQTLPKERATGSFAQPEKQLFDARVATDVISKLQGITSGVAFTVDPASGQRNLVIRGRSTIFANAAPLIVVDNFPYEGDISNINPNDVEDVTVLKDAAAASIWGVRASNGVIVITTKKGKLNRPLRVNLNSNVTVGEKPDLFYDPNFLPANEFTEVERTFYERGLYDVDLLSSDPSDPFAFYPPISPLVEILNRRSNNEITQAEADAQLAALKQADVRNDLKRYFYRNAVNQQHNINLSGGGNNATYFFSAGYDKNLQAQKANDYERITLNFLSTFTPVKNLELSAGINYIAASSTFDNTLSQINMGGFNGKYIYPYAQLADASGNPLAIVKDYRSSFAEAAPANGFFDWQFLPLQELREGRNTGSVRSDEARINTALKYTLFKGLSAEVRYQYQRINSNTRDMAARESYYVRDLANSFATVVNGMPVTFNLPLGGILATSQGTQTGNYLRGQLNYIGKWGKHGINAIAGVEQREVKNSTISKRVYGYDPSTGIDVTVDYLNFFDLYPNRGFNVIASASPELHTLDRFRSQYGNIAYSYHDKYTLTVSGRADGSNFFGVRTNQKTVPLWSVGGKWDINKERFYGFGWLPQLSLRATYGYNGNVSRTVTAYTTVFYRSNAPLIGSVRNATITNPPNPDLGWERSRMINLGIDFASEKNIISGSLEVFQKRGIDLMGDELLAPSVGFFSPSATNSFTGNFAGMRSSGADIVLNSQNINGKLRWNTNLVFSYAKDKVTRFDVKNRPSSLVQTGNGNVSNFFSPREGYPVFGIFSYKWGGLDPVSGDPRGYAADTLSTAYSAISNPNDVDDIVYHGPGRPVIFGGLTNNLSWNNFALSFNISFKAGYYFRRSSVRYLGLYYSNIGHIDYADRWQKPGDEQRTSVPSMPADVMNSYNRDQFYSFSEVLVEKADHVRLQDVSLSYTLDKTKWAGMPLNRIVVFANGSNLGILWRANDHGLDPDVYSGFPIPRSYSFGVKADF